MLIVRRDPCWLLAWLTLKHWSWKYYVPPKHLLVFTRLHGVLIPIERSHMSHSHGNPKAGHVQVYKCWVVSHDCVAIPCSCAVLKIAKQIEFGAMLVHERRHGCWTRLMYRTCLEMTLYRFSRFTAPVHAVINGGGKWVGGGHSAKETIISGDRGITTDKSHDWFASRNSPPCFACLSAVSGNDESGHQLENSRDLHKQTLQPTHLHSN